MLPSFAAGLFVSGSAGTLPSTIWLFAAYPLIWFGTTTFRVPLWRNGWDDVSYGTYLYGWPVEMCVRAAVGPGWTGYALAAMALPPALAVGWLSWRFVERPALELKRVDPSAAFRTLRKPGS